MPHAEPVAPITADHGSPTALHVLPGSRCHSRSVAVVAVQSAGTAVINCVDVVRIGVGGTLIGSSCGAGGRSDARLLQPARHSAASSRIFIPTYLTCAG